MTTLAGKYFPELTALQRQQLSLLPGLYRKWNAGINVISRRDIDNFEINHLLHSLAIAKFISFHPGTKVIDIGTGGGLPGIPLAILFPETQFTLVDSIAKKIRVAASIASDTGLTNVITKTGRSEKISGAFDFIIGRAVAEMHKFVTMTSHLKRDTPNRECQEGWIVLKGGDLKRELAPFGSATQVIPLNKWFDIPFFETKKLVWLPFAATLTDGNRKQYI